MGKIGRRVIILLGLITIGHTYSFISWFDEWLLLPVGEQFGALLLYLIIILAFIFAIQDYRRKD